MNYGKLMNKLISRRSHQDNTKIVIALVAGVAVGAVLSILLAPKKGSVTRKDIASRARNVGGNLRDSYASLKNKVMGVREEEAEAVAPEVPHFTHTVTKRRKSDIKSIIADAHQSEHHTDEAIHE
ncbi:MAG: YtxH domain-containing protein [Chitinophagaceae bacterium]|nr:MAG: YtxH domain-containing protein [Chitinophagaceae bacterium]